MIALCENPKFDFPIMRTLRVWVLQWSPAGAEQIIESFMFTVGLRRASISRKGSNTITDMCREYI